MGSLLSFGFSRQDPLTHTLRPRRAACLAALIGFLALIVVSGGCASQAPAAQGSSVDGAQLFDRACAKCHGAEGRGGLPTVSNGPRPIDFRNVDWQRSRTDAEIIAAIRAGRGAMPPFADVLSMEETTALAAYVRQMVATPLP